MLATTSTDPTLMKPAELAPDWLKVLMMLGQRLPRAAVDEAAGARAVVVAPTTRHVAASLAVSAVTVPTDVGSSAEVGDRVASVVSKEFIDATVLRMGARMILNGVQFGTERQPPMIRLNEEWRFDRPSRDVPSSGESAARRLIPGRAGEWTYFNMCQSPVVVLTPRPAQLVQDLEDLNQVPWWNAVQSCALAGPSDEAYNNWFRRPVVAISPTAVAEHNWVASLPASMVVVVGFGAWQSQVRHAWSSVPQILVMSQRSPDMADFREWFDGTQFPKVDLGAVRNLRKGGLVITPFGEPIGAFDPAAVESEDDDEWMF